MPTLETVIHVSENLKKPKQAHEKLETWFNIYNDPLFSSEIYVKKNCDIFGFIPKGFDFANQNIIGDIVDLFNKDADQIAFIMPDINKETVPYFINKTIVPNDFVIDSLEGLLELIEELQLVALKIGHTEGPIFIYE